MSTFWNNPVTDNRVYQLSAVGILVLIIHTGITLLYFVANGVIKYHRKRYVLLIARLVHV